MSDRGKRLRQKNWALFALLLLLAVILFVTTLIRVGSGGA